MKIRTVCGDIAPEALGITLAHEHLLCDISSHGGEPPIDPYLRSVAERPVDCSIVGDLLRDPMISKDSLRLTDINVAMDELAYFKAAGGQSLVEQTSRWVGGDPVALRRISKEMGIHIVAASSHSDAPPEYIEGLAIDQLADELVGYVEEGFDGTGIRAGIIGELLTSWPIKPAEEKALRAAARAQVRTGAALSIHPSCWDKEALPLLDIVESEGVDPRRVVMCHLDHVMDVEYHKSIAARGAYVQYDRCGIERYGGDLERNLKLFPRDPERVAGVIGLIASGYLSQILLSQDVCMKIELKRYAGPGYGHILRHVAPMMGRMGVSKAHIDTILVSNPREMLAF
jgi:phosphotriesterase-related protein